MLKTSTSTEHPEQGEIARTGVLNMEYWLNPLRPSTEHAMEDGSTTHENEVDLAQVAFVVVPPGHGKSFLHGGFPGLVEADSVINNKGNSELTSLRIEARRSGMWDTYDKHWSACIQSRLTRAPWVVMVPAYAVGAAAGWTYLGGAALDKLVWEQNLRGRKGSVAKYQGTWDDAVKHSARFCSDNDQVNSHIVGLAIMWIEGVVPY